MKFGDLTYLEIQEWIIEGSLAIVPTGCTEQQGPHLPVDFDTWFSEAVCEAAADLLERKYHQRVLVLPALPFGPTPEHRNFGTGFIDLSQEVHETAITEILRSLASQGFQRIVIWRGCGQHSLGGVVKAFNDDLKGKARAFLPELPYQEIWFQIGNPSDSGGHADSFATSIQMYRRPGAVRTDKIFDPKSKPVDWDDSNLDFVEYSSTGVIGNPTFSSVELGEKLWQAVVEKVADILKGVAGANLTEPSLPISS